MKLKINKKPKSVKKLVYILLIAAIFVGCKKEEQSQPQIEVIHAKWKIHFEGSDTSSFKVMFYSSTPPFVFVPYEGTVHPIEVDVVVGQYYAVQYRDTDNMVKIISHTVNDFTTIYDTLPATIL